MEFLKLNEFDSSAQYLQFNRIIYSSCNTGDLLFIFIFFLLSLLQLTLSLKFLSHTGTHRAKEWIRPGKYNDRNLFIIIFHCCSSLGVLGA